MAENLIFYGTLPDDHTGDKNRTCWTKADAMFHELYSLIGSASPVVGSKYPVFRASVRHSLINQQSTNDLFYISKIICGTSAGAGLYNYEVDINRVHDVTGAGTLVVKFNQVFNHIIADMLAISLGAAIAEYISGFMVIDFSKLTTGTTYLCANWTEGGVMNVATSKPFDNGGDDGDGGKLTLPEFTGSTTADGSLPIYLFNSDVPVTCRIDSIANIKGDIKVKNKGVGVVTIQSVDDLEIDGSPSLQLSQGQFAQILGNVDKFEAFGQYTAVPLTGGLHMQSFTATEGQSVFTVTQFSLSDAAQVYIDGALQESNYTRTGNVITFSGGLGVGQKVKIYN